MTGEAYKSTGVDYDVLDAGKRRASAAAASTSALMAARGAQALDASRGEPAFVWSMDGRHMALVLECLGTKSVIADEVLASTGVNLFDVVGYDTVAAAVNDLVCVGALPLTVNAYFASGSASWFGTPAFDALVDGWRDACDDAGATWGGGESPALPDVLLPERVDLAAAAVGAVPAGREPLLGRGLSAGDAIVVVTSSGLHANGASLARRVASGLPDGWATPLEGGAPLGEAVLTRTTMYAALVEALPADGVRYLSNITGHGALKLMRADAELTYVMHSLPPVPPELAFLAASAGLDDRSAYTVFNMGLGFAVYCAADAADSVVAAAIGAGYDAAVRGSVEAGPRRVVLEPLGVEYGTDELALR